jgi:hypothetical protein
MASVKVEDGCDRKIDAVRAGGPAWTLGAYGGHVF